MPVLALLWVWYPLTVVAIVAGTNLCCSTPGARVAPFALAHLGLAALAVVVHLLTRSRSVATARVVWSLFTCVGLPSVFSALGMVLPMVNPEPWEWWCIATDRALCGRDPIPVLQRGLSPLVVEILQTCYASFYVLPIVALLGTALARRGDRFDHGLAIVAFGFQTSYLGYLVWPTLGPNRLGLWPTPAPGLGLSEHLHRWIDEAEANWWDCFPSGHTMLSLIAVVIAFRGSRRLGLALVPVASCVVIATMALRYHYATDVLAGVAGAALVGVLAPFIRPPARPRPSPAAAS